MVVMKKGLILWGKKLLLLWEIEDSYGDKGLLIVCELEDMYDGK